MKRDPFTWKIHDLTRAVYSLQSELHRNNPSLPVSVHAVIQKIADISNEVEGMNTDRINDQRELEYMHDWAISHGEAP